jgi:hypothetical protein
MWNNIKTNFGSKGGNENIIVMDSIVMTIEMLVFSKPFKIFILPQNFTCFFWAKSGHAFSYEVISFSM